MKNQFFVFLIGLFLPVTIIAQPNVDSLKKEIRPLPSDTNKLHLIFDAVLRYKLNYPVETGELASLFYDEAVKQEENLWWGKAATEMGTYYFYSDQLDSALFYFKDAYQAHERAKSEEGMAVALSTIGKVYVEKSECDS